jgi:hypothetical protein
MSRKNVVGVLLMAIMAYASSCCAKDTAVISKNNLPDPTYNLDAGSACVISLQVLVRIEPLRTLAINKTPQCSLSLNEEVGAISKLLSAAQNDGVDISSFKTFELGMIDQPAWRERMTACYVARFGGNDRHDHLNSRNGMRIFNQCPVFQELEAIFRHYYVAIKLSELEERIDLDFSDNRTRKWMKSSWARKYLGYSGTAVSGGIAYFDIARSQKK